MLRKFILFISTISIIACSTNSEKTKKLAEDLKKKNEVEQENRKRISDSIVKAREITWDWRNIESRYSLDYQKYFDNSIQVIDSYEILDIYAEKDELGYPERDKHYLFIAAKNQNIFNLFYIKLSISIEDINLLSKCKQNPFLIIDIKTIRKVTVDIKTQGDDDVASGMIIDQSSKIFNSFLCHGELIKVIPY